MNDIRDKLAQDISIWKPHLHCLQYQRWRVFLEDFCKFLNGLSCRPRQGQSFHTKIRQLKKLEEKSSFHYNHEIGARLNSFRYGWIYENSVKENLSRCSSFFYQMKRNVSLCIFSPPLPYFSFDALPLQRLELE